MTQTAHTNGRAQLSAEEMDRTLGASRPAIDTHGEPVPDPPPPAPPAAAANGANGTHPNGSAELVDQLEATLWMTALQGVEQVVNVAATLPPGATRNILLNTLPEEFRTTRALDLLRRISDADAGMLIAWVCRQWWDAYGLGHVHHEDGQDWRGAPPG